MHPILVLILLIVVILVTHRKKAKFGLAKFEQLFADAQAEVERYRETLRDKISPEVIELVTELLPGTMISTTKNSVKAMGGVYTAPDEAKTAIATCAAQITANHTQVTNELERADRKTAWRERRIQQIRARVALIRDAATSLIQALTNANARLENRKKEVAELRKYM
ncbi:MAG: hypothetical protein AAB631_00450 [Patescibacteria group bacterium]